jgi:hypothetical protein
MAMIEMNLPRFEFHLESGALALHDGFAVIFFLPGSHQQNCHFVRASIEAYLNLPGMAEILGTIDEEGYPILLDASGLETVIADRLVSGHNETTLHIVDTTEGASSFSIDYFGLDPAKQAEADWPNAVSGIRFTFPTDFLGETGLLEIFNFANEIAAFLPFSFGYVSPAFVFHEGVGEPAAFEVIRGLSRRYRCIDIPALLLDCLEVGEGPKGAYWGNYLSASMVKQLGGEAGIRIHFAAQDVRIRSYDNLSMSIYLSRIPLAGDVNRCEDISTYKAAAHLFADLILPRSVPYLDFDEEAMAEWLNRFANE